MATHDYVIANGTGAAVRSDLNNALAAIVSNNSGSSEPGTTYAFQWWADTTANVLKIRNSANNAWITLRELDGTILMEDGTVGAPGLAFAADLDTGILRPGDNQINFATAGAERLSIGSSEIVFNEPSNDVDFRVESNGQTHMLFVDGGNDTVSIGTSTASNKLRVHGSSDTPNVVVVTGADETSEFIALGVDSGVPAVTAGGVGDTSAQLAFRVSDSGTESEAARIDASGRLLMGHSSNQQNQLAQINTTNGACLGLYKFAANDDGAELGFAASRNASVGSHTIVNEGDYIGRIFFRGSDGDEFVRGAEIAVKVDGTPGNDDMPGRIEFYTTANGAAVPTERLRINSAGRFFFNETSSDLGHKYILSGNESADVAAFQYNNNSGTYLAIKTEAANGVVELKADARSGNFPALVFRTGNVDRGRITKDGDYLIGTDDPQEYSLGRGNLNVGVASSLGNQHAVKAYVTNTSFSETGGGIKFTGCRRSATSSFSFGGWYSGNGSTSVASDKEFNLRGDGNAYADGSWNGGGADYAEYFEWSDGNTSDEDRRGISVVLDGDKIREAVAGEEPIGVISGNPSVVGDSDIDRWKGKYLRDDYGTHLQQTHNVVKWNETITDEDGNESIKEHDYEDWNLPEGIVVPDDAVVSAVDDNGKPFTHRILNPDYNPDTAYISREDRPEWATVGLMGKLRIRKGQVTGARWIKMRDVSDAVEEWLVR